MAAYAGSYYPIPPSDVVPTVDHDHRRSSQHQPIWHFGRRDEDKYPNRPDVDIRDLGAYYLVDVEVPGVKDPGSLHLQWTDASTLVLSGMIARPTDEESSIGDQSNHPQEHVIIGERRVGKFQRRLTFPHNVDPDPQKLQANVEAGLLRIKILKKEAHLIKGDGLVKVTSNDQ